MPPADPKTRRELPSEYYVLEVRQQPKNGKATSAKEKDRKPLDPPPIVNLVINDPADPTRNYLQSPYFMLICCLWDAEQDQPATIDKDPNASSLAGSISSSLHKLKDPNNSDGGFFVFPDLTVRPEGIFRLKFVLYEVLQGEAAPLQSILTEPFTVHSPKNFPGMAESTFTSRSFADQGVRLRIRKDTRPAAAKRSARSQGEDSHYHPKPTDSHMAPQSQYGYGEPSGFMNRQNQVAPLEYLPKRPKYSESPSFDREQWPQYSQGPHSAPLYSPQSGNSMSNFSQGSSAATPSSMNYAAMRSPVSENQLAQQQQFYQQQRGPVQDYTLQSPHQALALRPEQHHAQYVHHDPPSNLHQYGPNAAYSGMAHPGSHAHNAQSMRTDFNHPAADQSMRQQQNYPMGIPSGSQSSTVLPPLGNAPAVGTTSNYNPPPQMLPSQYGVYPPGDNNRRGYNNMYPQALTMQHATYPST